MSDNLKYVDFSGDFKKYLNTRPVSVCCFKREESVEDWSDVFVAVCRGLYMHQPLRFDKTTGSHKFQAIISRSERKLLCPRQFSQFRYCETDLSLQEILGWIRQLADGLGLRHELIQIQVQELPPETLENCTQAERCRWIRDGIERLRRHGNVLDFEFDVPSYVYAYTKPVSLTVRTTDGLFQTGTPFDKLCYQFDNWQDIVERIMAWMTLIDAEFLVDGLKHDCDAAITKAISFSYTQMKRPFLLHEHEYIDLEVFDNHIVLCIETLCAIADRAELTPNDLRITFEIDEEKLNSMLAEEAAEVDEVDEVDAAEVDAAESDEDEVNEDEVDEVDGDEVDGDEVDGDEVDGDEVDGDEVDGDEVDESDELEESQIRLVKKYYEFTLANDNWEAYAEDQVTAYQDKKVSSWPEVFEAFCDELYEIEGKSLIHKFKNDGLIHRNYNEYHRPYQIGDTGYYIETEREVLKMLKLMSILCDELEIDKDSFCIGTSAMVEVDEDEVDEDEVDDEFVTKSRLVQLLERHKAELLGMKFVQQLRFIMSRLGNHKLYRHNDIIEAWQQVIKCSSGAILGIFSCDFMERVECGIFRYKGEDWNDEDEVCENELDDDEIDEDDDEAYNEFEEDEVMGDGAILVNWDGDLDCYVDTKLGVSCTSTPKQQIVPQNNVVRRVYDHSQPMDANNRVSWNNHNPYGNAENLNSVDSGVMQVDFEHLNSSKHEYSEPVYLSCFDKTNYLLKAWKDVLVNVVKEVYAKFGKFIFINAYANWGIASQVDGDLIGTRKLRFPKEIAKSIYIESNYGTEKILRIIKALMDFCRISYDKVVIRYVYQNIPKRAPKGSVNRLSSRVTTKQVSDSNWPMDANNRVSWNNHNPYGNAENLNSGYSGVMQIDFKHLEGVHNHTRPIFISCFGVENNSIKTWKDAFVEVVRDIYDHKHDFIITNAPKWFAGKIGIAYTADNMRRPVQIARNVYLETNYSSLDILRMIKRLMDISGIPYHQCVICYTQKND